MISFFRKYQKPLLLVLIIFAVVTFSVTTTMSLFFEQVFDRDPAPRPWMTFPSGEHYRITQQDQNIATDVYQLFVQRLGMLDLGHVPEGELDPEEIERQGAYDFHRVLILMCAAREAGIGLSELMVADFAKSQFAKFWLKIEDQQGYERVVRERFGVSLARFEAAYAEYVRIRFYIDALSLGENLSVLSVLDKAAETGEELKAELVSFGAHEHEGAIKEEGVEDETLLAFLSDLEIHEKEAFIETKLVDLELAWVPVGTRVDQLREAVAALEPAEDAPAGIFLEDLSKLAPISDPAVQSRYDQDKWAFYRKESEPATRPVDQEPATRPVEEPQTPPATDSESGLESPDQAEDDPGRESADQPADRVAEDQGFRALDETLLEEIRASLELERALDLVFSQVKDAAKEKGQEFDLEAFARDSFPFLRVTRTGFKRAADLPKASPLEGWALSHQALGPAEGEFCPSVYHSRGAHFFARVAGVKENEPRPIEEIRESLTSVYIEKEARKRAEKSAHTFIARLRQLGRQTRPEQIDSFEAEVAAAVEKRRGQREDELQATIARLQKNLEDPAIPAGFRVKNEKALTQARERLEALPEIEAQFRKEEEEKREPDRIALELEDAGSHFGEAARELGLQLVQVDFFPKNLHLLDRDAIEEEPDDAVRYLKGSAGVAKLAALEKGRVTDSIEDFTNRAFVIFHLVDRRDRDVSQLTPRELEEQLQTHRREARTGFARSALAFEALRRRFDYRGFIQEEEYKAYLERRSQRTDTAAEPAHDPAKEDPAAPDQSDPPPAEEPEQPEQPEQPEEPKD